MVIVLPPQMVRNEGKSIDIRFLAAWYNSRQLESRSGGGRAWIRSSWTTWRTQSVQTTPNSGKSWGDFYQLDVNPSHLHLRRALPAMDQIECSDYEGRGNEGKDKLDAEDIEVQSFMGREKKEDNYWERHWFSMDIETWDGCDGLDVEVPNGQICLSCDQWSFIDLLPINATYIYCCHVNNNIIWYIKVAGWYSSTQVFLCLFIHLSFHPLSCIFLSIY